LKAPLEAIEEAARRLRGDSVEVGIVSDQARRAAEVVDRLLAFTRKEEEDVAPFDLTPVLRVLIESREQARKERGIRFQNLLSVDPIFVAGSRHHLQQVFLSLISHAEESALKTTEKAVMVRETTLAGGVQIEIDFSGTGRLESDPFGESNGADSGVLGLGVCRSIVRGQGGDLRIVAQTDGFQRFEIELRAEPAGAGAPGAAIPFADVRITALLVEPDGDSRRRLTALLSEAGHRVIPAGSGEEALETAGRFHFEVVFCSTRLAGMDCVELLERTRDRVDAFVFLRESYNGEGAHALPHGEGYVLTKPVAPDDLDRVLLGIRERLAARPQ
jgi:CheY-like chemotaxis protein